MSSSRNRIIRPADFRKGVWYQVGGDTNGLTYGCTLAMFDGDYIHVREIQPACEYVGEREGADVGYPFWTREASYDLTDIRRILGTRNDRGWAPLDYVGLDIPADARLTRDVRVTVACAALDYGYMAEEGPAGWSADVLPRRLGRDWHTPTRADGHEADRDYRGTVRLYGSR